MSFLDDAAKSMAKALYEDFYRGMVGGAVAASVPAYPQIGAAVQDVAAGNIPSAAQAAATAAAAYAAPTPEELLKSITSAASSNDASATGTVLLAL
jgi:hypothetical protein